MFFLEILELFVVLFVLVFSLFQILIPMWNGTLLFPIFRSKSRKLEQQLRQARSDLEVSQEEQKLQELKGKSDDNSTSV